MSKRKEKEENYKQTSVCAYFLVLALLLKHWSASLLLHFTLLFFQSRPNFWLEENFPTCLPVLFAAEEKKLIYNVPRPAGRQTDRQRILV